MRMIAVSEAGAGRDCACPLCFTVCRRRSRRRSRKKGIIMSRSRSGSGAGGAGAGAGTSVGAWVAEQEQGPEEQEQEQEHKLERGCRIRSSSAIASRRTRRISRRRQELERELCQYRRGVNGRTVMWALQKQKPYV
jgi:hypothetical protein